MFINGVAVTLHNMTFMECASDSDGLLKGGAIVVNGTNSNLDLATFDGKMVIHISQPVPCNSDLTWCS